MAGRKKTRNGRVPQGCCHPDCFHCPLEDCRRSELNAESTEINEIIKRQLKAEDAQRKESEAQFLQALYWQQNKRGRGRPRTRLVN